MTTHSGIHKNINTGPWTKCVATATKLENIMVKSHEEKCAHKNFCDNIPDYGKYLNSLKKMGVVHSIISVK